MIIPKTVMEKVLRSITRISLASRSELDKRESNRIFMMGMWEIVVAKNDGKIHSMNRSHIKKRAILTFFNFREEMVP